MEIKASPANGKIPTSPSAQTPVGFDMSWENPKFNEEREVTFFFNDTPCLEKFLGCSSSYVSKWIYSYNHS